MKLGAQLAKLRRVHDRFNQLTMKRILFVDDSELLREVFGVMLSREKEQWEVMTASDGRAALELLKKFPIDIVASDMRMPGMDGIELLSEVGRLYPQISRIIISGMGDQGTVADALGSTHQFLVKPVTVKALRSTLVRIDGLDAYLKDEKLKALASKLKVVPSFPALYLEIMKLIDSPNSSLESIAEIIVRDPGITAKMLQVANSAAFGAAERIHDPAQAVQQLGMNTVRSLVLSAHVYESFAPSPIKGFSVDKLWSHLMKCGNSARAIMHFEHADVADIEDAFTAGILHDIGKLMLADSMPKEFQQALKLSAERQVSLHEVEMEIFGATHAGLAAYLLGLWGLPASIVEAVAFHHTPEMSTNVQFGPLTAVHVANAFEHGKDEKPSDLNREYLTRIGMVPRIKAWREELAGLGKQE